jgi:hypothetical protein
VYNDRNHRVDIFSLFGRDTFQRQTGGGTINSSRVDRFVDPMTSQEAWIWYGHVLLPDNNGNFAYTSGLSITPGSGDFNSNPNGYYASQFTLGRVAMLLQDPDSTTGAITTYEKAGAGASIPVDHTYVRPVDTSSAGTAAATALWPFKFDALTSITLDLTTKLQHSRYDLAGASMGSYRSYLQSFIASNPGYDWWHPLMLAYRYQASPYVLNVAGNRLTPAAVAQQAPIFLSGCSQFIVEYAGDFIEQDNDANSSSYGELKNVYFDTGAAVTPGTDGEIDYVWDPATSARRVRWYGMPRDVNGDGRINGGPGHALRDLLDVVPLRDVLRTAATPTAPSALVTVLTNAATAAPFERFQSYTDVTLPARSPLQIQNEYITTKLRDEFYTCAWGPGDRKPSMIRVTFVLDDPEGQLGDPQTFEYIFKVQ